MTKSYLRLVVLLTGAGAMLSCNVATEPNFTPPVPASLSSLVDNPYFPLFPGDTLVYLTQTRDGLETDTVIVLPSPKTINGAPATEVHDRVYVAGALTEDTYDWYAEDNVGNVWYLGEDTKQYANGQVVGTVGTWQWGVRGATPGIIAWANPDLHLGKPYRQEFDHGVAEDWGRVVATNQSLTVPYGSLTGCVKTQEWNKLEPFSFDDYKYYCPNVGIALETSISANERTELVSITP